MTDNTKKKSAALGRPSLYTPGLVAELCSHIADCKSLAAIERIPGMPSRQTVLNWLADKRKPEFLAQYARAREAQADKMAEDIIAIADEECTMVRSDKHASRNDDGDDNTEVVFDATAVARNRLRVDARKWLAAKMAPKKYGDKVENVVTGADGGPVRHRVEIGFVKPEPRE